jgi:predicted GNAT family acetyltransferase
MTKQLFKENEKEIMNLVSDESSINLFIIGDIENFGFNTDFQQVWGDYNQDELKGVLLKYYNNVIIYYKDLDFDENNFFEIIQTFEDEKVNYGGKKEVLDKFRKFFQNSHNTKDSFMCEFSKENLQIESKDIAFKIGDLNSAEKTFKFINAIEEFSTFNDFEIYKKRFITSSGRLFYVENENGEVIHSCESTAECSKGAMIIGVATAKEYRGKGYTTSVLGSLCKELLLEGKKPCLFFDNPKAGSIYLKMGFEKVGTYTMFSPK